ncbi:hypothetical protein QSJ18_14045 [Gordonia sp. ABSL1-1]|uniref:hypothetical protein n=1 Tax=Gordonia sp. ABSL1-1 TaxID=3053923 RepID=UPI002573B79E|nr:hypothetical protein [Gordonia sp. ABSL1-1]MDL9937871.1 hypothetical protein [Gordonia sp. ABSL1-1]
MNHEATATRRRAGLPGWRGILTERRGGPLVAHRAAARLSAYVYGNILVLAAIAVATVHTVEDGVATLIVLGTGAVTYLAHVFSAYVAYTALPEGHQHADPAGSQALRETPFDELRDAVPIVSSTIWPAVVLALGWVDVLPPRLAELIAGALVVLRMATIQIVIERIRGNPPGWRVVVAGLATAAAAAIIVLVKVSVGH